MAGKKTILYVDPSPHIGGAEVSLLEMLTALDRGRYNPVAAVPCPSALAERVRETDTPVISIPAVRLRRHAGPGAWVAQLRALLAAGGAVRRAAKRHGAAIIHANGNTAQLVGAVSGCAGRVPLIWHSRDLVALGRLASWMASRADCVAAISRAVDEHLRVQGVPSAKLVLLRNGIDTRRIRARRSSVEVRRELGFAVDDVVIGTIGQLVPWKRQDLFLEAATRIATRMPAARFLLLGGDLFQEHGDYVHRLHARAETPPLRGRVRFCGFRDDAADIVAAMNVVLHPAAREPFGRVVAESMWLGRPVVAVDDAGPSELIRSRQSGLLTPPDDADALATAALELITDGDWAGAIGQMARNRIRRHFGMDTCMRSLEGIYDSL